MQLVQPSTASTSDTFSLSANERRVLSIIRKAGEMPSAEIARLADLSAQSASVITRALEANGIISKGPPTRGKVGKPLTPFMLNPDGAFSIGLRIGRRSADMVLIDITGDVRGDLRTTYPYPTPDSIIEFARNGLDKLRGCLDEAARGRLIGFGIGTPFEMWNWQELTATPRQELMAWKGFDLGEAFSELTDLPVLVANDTSMACTGEHAFGGGADQTDFVYFYVGSLVGGGVVLNDRAYLGPKGNAAAFGSLPVVGKDGSWRQLNTQASIVQLEEALNARWPGRGADLIHAANWTGFDDLLDDWLGRTADGLAYASLTSVVAFDLPQIVIDCSAPAAIRTELVARVSAVMESADTRGIVVPRVVEGHFGPKAGALGAGYQPILTQLFDE
ncbi:MAG: ROK family transcriptional regulator [Pseudomonadota bacterium]